MKGEIMSPCGTPCSKRIFPVRCPPMTMWATLSVKNNLTQSIMSSPKLKAFKVCEMNSD